MAKQTVSTGTALGVMGASIVVLPLYFYLSSVVTGGSPDSGPVVAAVVFTLLTLMLAVVFLPVVVVVLGRRDRVQVSDLVGFVLAVGVAHGLAVLLSMMSDSQLPLLAYPIVAAVAWAIPKAAGRG